jgi:hypothetical protein
VQDVDTDTVGIDADAFDGGDIANHKLVVEDVDVAVFAFEVFFRLMHCLFGILTSIFRCLQ